MASFSPQPSLSLCPTLSFSSRLPQPRNADFQPQGLKSGWRGANYYGKENKTQREEKEIENEEKEEGERQMQRGRKGEDQHCCSLEEK